jgi:TusE/DsrC/DsvC family sulfur relay protein
MTQVADFSILETLEYDDDGFMLDASAWTPEIGTAIAAVLEIELTPRHWDVINFARSEFEEEGEAPTLRRISKVGGVPMKELYNLFPGGPAKIAAKIAGLPKPTGCI